MIALGTRGLRALKICHLLFAIMWIGGVMALVSVQLGIKPTTSEMMYMAARCHLVIDEFFLIPGGIGIIVTALAYGRMTKWGFFKHRWLTVKWILTFVLVVIGAGYMGVVIKENMAYTVELLDGNVDVAKYWSNVYHVAIAGIVQLLLFVYVVFVSVAKPWKKSL